MNAPALAPWLPLFAQAACGQPVNLAPAASASRWRGPIGSAHTLALPPGLSARGARLQVLRHALDLREDGRHRLNLDAARTLGLVGERASIDEDASAIDTCIASWPLPLLLRRLFLWIDGARVDALLAAVFPGAAGDRLLDRPPASRVGRHVLSTGHPPPRNATEALQLALALHLRLLAGQPRHRVAVESLRVVPASTEEAPPASGSARFEVASGDDPLAFDGPGASSDGSAEAETAAAASGADPKAAAGTAAATTPIDGVPHAHDAVDQESAEPQQEPFRQRPAATPSIVTLHDEWDHVQQAYRRRWTHVHEQRIEGGDPAFLPSLRARFAGPLARMQRRLRALRADRQVTLRRQPDGDTIDLEAALDWRVERHAARQPADDRLYRHVRRAERQLSVALLLDMSGSTSQWLADAQAEVAAPANDDDDLLWQVAVRRAPADTAPRRRVIDVARDAIGLVCEALSGLGDRHAVYGFSGDGREQVDFYIAKDFDSDWTARSAAALGAMEPRRSTRTGAAVRHATARLMREPARRRLLVVLSDGYPQDRDYGSDPADVDYGVHDTARALREAERAGVATFNVSVDAAANDYLRRMCPKRRYLVIDEVAELPRRMVELSLLIATSG